MFYMTWTRTEIGGKPAEVFDPGAGASPVALLWLHDESANSPTIDPTVTAELGRHRLRCLAPHGGRSWWLDRICPEFDPELTAERHLLNHVLPWARSLGARVVAAAGIGMGGQGAVRLGFRHPQLVPVVASIDGAFDFHERYGHGSPLDTMFPSREYARQDTAILHVDAHRWPAHIWFACSLESIWYRGNDRLHEKLTAMGVPHTAHLDAPADRLQLVAPMIASVVAALERECRRLL